MQVMLLRHGATIDTIHRRYSGRRDPKLCAKGIEQARLLSPLVLKAIERLRGAANSAPLRVYTSYLRRAIATSTIVFSRAPYKIEVIPCRGLNEMDFGLFEGHNAKELSSSTACPRLSPLYSKWVASGCLAPCPLGESKEGFCRRVIECFKELRVKEEANSSLIVIVAHWGTIMALREDIQGAPYFNATIKPASYIVLDTNDTNAAAYT